MKKVVSIFAVIALSFLAGCGENETSVETEVEAGRPATPPPSNDETDTALTQTVEIGDERSPQEGGVLTDPKLNPGVAAAQQPPAGSTTTTATGSTTPATP